MRLLGKVPRAPVVLVVAHAVVVLTARKTCVAQVDVVVVHHAPLRAALVIEQDIVESDAVPLGMHMEFSYRVGLIAGISERLGERGDLGKPEIVFEHPVAMPARAQARHQRASRRDANWTFRVRTGKAHPRLGDLVESGRKNHGVTGNAKHLPGPMVRADQQDIRLLGHLMNSCLSLSVNRDRARQ
ncbi:hypothetical protein D9M72_500870 [compost metagenome]